MQLDAYFKRIEYRGPERADLDTLAAVHHQHLQHIPYENLDVQFGRPLDFDTGRIYQKLVVDHRGGWCYEMNGLLLWALESLGFQVRRLSGAVMRETQGDTQLGNHLVLAVTIDGVDYIADTGLGDGLREPVPLREGSWVQGGLTYRLEKLEDGFWRFHNHAWSNVRSFDFRDTTADEGELASKCQWLQTSPDSPFKMALVVHRFDSDRIHVLVGKVYTEVSASGKHQHTLDSAAALNATLAGTFGLHVDVRPLWPAIEAAHERFSGSS